jgi:hypothetical protein
MSDTMAIATIIFAALCRERRPSARDPERASLQMAQEALPKKVDELAGLGLPPALARVPGQPKHCVHPSVWQWSGKCEGCLLEPLPASEERASQSREDAA